MIRILVCDREKKDLQVNSIYIDEFLKKRNLSYTIECFAGYGEKLEGRLQEKRVDIAFLEVDLQGKVNGINLAKRIQEENENAIIIFMSERIEFAWQAYSIGAFSFLEKPINTEKFNAMFRKGILLYSAILMSRKPKRIVSIGKNNLIWEGDIISVEKYGHQVIVHTRKEEITTYGTLKEITPQVTKSMFLNVRSGVLVNKRYIKEIRNEELYLQNGNLFYIPKRRKAQVLQEYEMYANNLRRSI